MITIRNLVVAASIMAMGLGGGLAQADHCSNNNSSRFMDSSHDEYCVYFYDCHCGRWKLYGCYCSYCEASKAAKYLKWQGLSVYIAN